jgi:hypothetical protein
METGDFKNYGKISKMLTWLFIVCLLIILILHAYIVTEWLKTIFGDKGQTLIKSFFFGSLGAIISSSIFLSRDKETNKQLFAKNQRSKEIDLPDCLDRQMYLHRVITSGALAVLGTLIIFAGLSYVDVKYTSEIDKQKYLIIVASFLIGLYQGKFLKFIDSLFDNIFRPKDQGNDESL